MLIENEEKGNHMFLKDPIDLETADTFPNTSSVKKHGDDSMLVLGNNHVHMLILRGDKRKFSTQFPLL